jgi:hypothetical protein
MFRRLVNTVRKIPVMKQNASAGSRRNFSAHGNSAWGAKHAESQWTGGHALGMGPKYQWEGYELPTIVLYAVMFWTLFDIEMREDEEMPLEVWAKNEALAREAAIERGETIEFGKYYWRPHDMTASDRDVYSLELMGEDEE